jgi:hypothetical protein
MKCTTSKWIDDLHPALEEQKRRTTLDMWHQVIIKELVDDNRVTLVVWSDSLYFQWQSSKCIVGVTSKKNLMHFCTY